MTSPFDRLINGIKYDGRLHYIEFIIEGGGDQNRLITNDDGGVLCGLRRCFAQLHTYFLAKSANAHRKGVE